MDAYNKINDILVNLFNEIWKMEENAIITDEFRDISTNDMHVIEAIGIDSESNMSSIAKKLDVTVGTLTTAMNSLVKKDYVQRERSERDRRKVFIHLTEKGERAYRHHKEFHDQMTQAVIERLDEEELKVLVKTLDGLSVFFRQSHKN